METNDKRGAFDRLVASMSSEDRADMLNKLKKNAGPAIQFVETEKYYNDDNISLRLKFKNESIFYRIVLWFRSLVHKKNTEELYNEDLLMNMAKRINRDHPGVINPHAKLLDNIFYDRLLNLKEAADFFKPYFARIDENPGDFYVYLGSFVAPSLEEKLKKKTDPFNLSFDIEPTNDVRNGLLHNLDEELKNINLDAKDHLYKAVCAINWLEHFSKLPFIHFSAQFTNLVGNSYTCPYKNASVDYEAFASVFTDIQQIHSEVLEALMLYSNRKDYSNKPDQLDVERSVKEFLAQANDQLAAIQMFISCVPVMRLGKIINGSYDWGPEKIEGVEAWFKAYRSSLRRLIDERWNDWLRERKKNILSNSLKDDFDLSEFPVLKNRPWLKLWTRVPFTCELTGGFLAWFEEEYYDKLLPELNVLIMEGIFTGSDVRGIYSEGLNTFVQSMDQIRDINYALLPDGEYGSFFEEKVNNKIRSFQVQSHVDNVMASIENGIRECTKKFLDGCRMMEKILGELFDSDKDLGQMPVQNFMQIKGHRNHEWREALAFARGILKKGVFYITQLEPIESGKNV